MAKAASGMPLSCACFSQRCRGIAFDAGAFAQRQAIAQSGQRMAFFGSPPIEVGGAHRIGHGLSRTFRQGAAQRVERLGIAADGRFLEPGARLDEIGRGALAT
jgi:hypothetical protein